MRVRLVLLLAAAAFYTNAEVDSVATDSTPSTATSRHLRAAEKDDAHVQRFLHALPNFGMLDDLTQHPGAMLMKLEPNVKQQALLHGDNFEKWVTYAKTYKGSSDDPDGHVVDLLRRHFTDVQLEGIIKAATMSEKTKAFAKALDDSFIVKKVMENGLKKSYADMKLGDKLDETAVMKWLRDVDRIDNRATLHVLLSLHKESDVFKMLFAAQEKGSAVAKRFMKELSEKWKLDNHNPYEVFKVMRLHQDENFLTSKALEIWKDYATVYNKRHGGDEMNLPGALLAYVPDNDLYRAIVAAEGNPATKQMAEKLQQECVTSWTQWYNKKKELFAQDDGSNDLGSKVLMKLSSFLLKNEQVDSKISRIHIATHDYFTALVNFINKAKTNPVYEKQATTLEKELHIAWKESNLHQDIAFKIYNARGKIKDDPMKAAWAEYRKKFLMAPDEQPPKSIT